MAIVRLEGLGKLKKINFTGARTRDLPACSIVVLFYRQSSYNVCSSTNIITAIKSEKMKYSLH
jgi:hypothetical protein